METVINNAHKDTMISVPFVNIAIQHSTIKDQIMESVGMVLDHGNFILGPEVSVFEKRFADYCGVQYAIGVDNGTNALFLSLKALGIGPGDEVITAANSFFASASCIALSGARPVLVDVRENLSIDPELVEKAITPRTKAIIPVHLTGRPADMDPIVEIARRYDLRIVEDAAQAVGAMYRGRKAGSLGDLGCFSMHPLKVLNAVGDGGVITTNDTTLYETLIKARNHGLRDRDQCEFWSLNARLDTIQAAILNIKINYIDQWIEARRSVADYYSKKLQDLVGVPLEHDYERSVYQTYVIRCERRDELQQHLHAVGVETKVHYPTPIHLQPAANSLGYRRGSFPVTERLAAEILSLPVYPELTQDQLQHVTDSIRSFYGC